MSQQSPHQAGLGRRLIALAVDWGLAVAISAGFFDYDAVANLLVFAVMTAVLVGTLGSTIGHVIVGIGVRRLDGGLPGPVKALVRTVSLCLVVPAVIWSPRDGRAMHDVWAGTLIRQVR